MSNEKNPNSPEKERNPSSKEVLLQMKESIGVENEFLETRRRHNKEGLYLLEVKVDKSTSASGGYSEYSYMRTGQYPEGWASETKIYVVSFDTNGVCDGGKDVAKYENGKWIKC